jgi:hypothetical protein
MDRIYIFNRKIHLSAVGANSFSGDGELKARILPAIATIALAHVALYGAAFGKLSTKHETKLVMFTLR